MSAPSVVRERDNYFLEEYPASRDTRISSAGPGLQRHPAVWGLYTLSHTDWQSRSRLGWTRETPDNQTFYYFADIGSDTDGREYISNNIFSVEDAFITRNNKANLTWEFFIDQEKKRQIKDPTIMRRWQYSQSAQEDKGNTLRNIPFIFPKNIKNFPTPS